MNLNYNILWFEDDEDWYESIIDSIREIIEDDLGFNMSQPLLMKNGEDINNIDYSKYDIILMDLNLEKSPTGDKLISKIRSLEIFTNIVFYSSGGVSKVSEKIKELELEGVYVSSRDGNSFMKKVGKIISSTVKKVQDLNNMRGLVMAQVAELDDRMVDILKTHSNKLDEQQRSEFISKRKKRAVQSLETMHKKLQEHPVDDSIFELRDFPTNQKWMSTKNVVASLNKKEISDLLSNYDKDIIQKRNLLAHVKQIPDRDGGIKLTNGDFIFNDDECKRIRCDLKIHTENLDKIQNLLNK